MKLVSVDRAAEIIGVSSATIRNWTRAGYIAPNSSHPVTFMESSVLRLKNRMGAGAFAKLKTRANKSRSSSHFLPEEYAGDAALAAQITAIASYVKRESLELAPVIFLAALKCLEQANEVGAAGSNNLFDLHARAPWARRAVKAAMQDWRVSLAVAGEICCDDVRYRHLYELINSRAGDDYLGLLYQSISSEGNKSAQGSYYTPSTMVDEALDQIKIPVATFLDPCCGTGKYLLRAAAVFGLRPENILGFDRDKTATHIAKINLLLAFRDDDFTPAIVCLDTLAELATGAASCATNGLIGRIDAIATNPPWGAYKNAKNKNRYSSHVKSGETFSLFLEKSIKLLRPGGQLSFILPESILKIRTHSDIRALILEQTKILSITSLGRPFTGVFSPVIRLDLIREAPGDDWLVAVEQNKKPAQIPQRRFKHNDDCTFDIAIGADEQALLEKIYAVPHLTLANRAEWALGIVTGDNKKYVLENPAPGADAVFRGADIFPYHLAEPQSFIQYMPHAFQQVAPEKFYRAPEKLVYRFISKKLVFAYDRRRQLTLNSANILIPALPGTSIKVALALLNSALFQYIFQSKFSTHKVLRGDLEKLPFPILAPALHDKIELLTDIAIATKEAPAELEALIFSAFSLDDKEIAIIRQAAAAKYQLRSTGVADVFTEKVANAP